MGMGRSLLLWMLFNGLNEVIPMGQMEISSLKISTKELISSVQYEKSKVNTLFIPLTPSFPHKSVITLEKYEHNRFSVFLLLHTSRLFHTSQSKGKQKIYLLPNNLKLRQRLSYFYKATKRSKVDLPNMMHKEELHLVLLMFYIHSLETKTRIKAVS